MFQTVFCLVYIIESNFSPLCLYRLNSYSEYVGNKINPEVDIRTTFSVTVQKKINKKTLSKKAN